MPVRNVAPYVGAAIESVLGQTFGDLELIISDNASSDGTRAICERYARSDRRITLIRQYRNIGAEPNFNAVADMATGSYFKWLGGDDVCEPTYVERCVEALASHGDAVLAYQYPIVIDEQGTRLSDPPSALSVDAAEVPARLAALLRNLHVSGGWHASIYSFCMMRTEAMRQAGPLGSYFASDNVFVLTMGLLGRFVDLDSRDLKLRVHADSWGQMFGESPSAREIQTFIDPSVTNPLRVYLNRHRRYAEYYKSVLVTPGLGIADRLRCLGLLNSHVLERVRGFVARRRARM